MLLVLLLLTGAPKPGLGGDVRLAGVLKGQALAQFTAGAPVPEPGLSHQFVAFVEASGAGAVTNATVQALPAGEVRPLMAAGNRWRLEETFSSLTALNAAYPSTSYRLTAGTLHDGQRQWTLPLAGSFFPNDPHIANFDAAQQIDPTREFALRWDAFAGGTASDFIQVRLEDSRSAPVYRTADVGQPGALTGGATSLTIPANTLPPGRALTARLSFYKLTSLDAQSYPGALAVAGFFKETVFSVATLGVPDTQTPRLVSSAPADGARGVPRTAVIVFTFSEAMMPLQSVAWSAHLDPRRVGYLWSDDQRALFCFYDGLLPGNTTISWTLNPAGQPPVFRDPSGNPLATVSGSFTTAGGVGAPDVEAFGVQKGQHYQQTAAGAPVLRSGTAFGFVAFAALSPAGALRSATVALPTGATNALQAAGRAWRVERTFATQQELSAACPNGAYTLVLEAVLDGAYTSRLNLRGDQFPNVPRVLNHAAAQAVDPTQPFTLEWEPFAGGSIHDWTHLRISDASGSVFETAPRPDAMAGLNGKSTAVTIPANTLLAAQTYRATLRFAKAVALDFVSYPGAIGMAGYFRETEFTVKTTGPTRADVAEYALVKQQTFVQNPLGSPGLESGTPFEFGATVTPGASGAVSSASVKLPTGASRPLAPVAGGDTWSFREAKSSSPALEAAYPVGTYTLTIATARDGTKTLPLDLPVSVYPPTPSVADLSHLQQIDARKALTIQWTPFLGAAANDGVRLVIFDTLDQVVFRPQGGDSGGWLSADQASVQVPANTLAAGRVYRGELTFARRTTLDRTTYPAARGVVAFHTRTKFGLATLPHAAPPRLERMNRTFDGKFQLRLVGEPNRTYAIDATASLRPTEWTQLVVVPSAGGAYLFVDDQSIRLPRRFYRARVVD